jgi:hypothetical protein
MGKRYSAAVTDTMLFLELALDTAFEERIPVLSSFSLNIKTVLLTASFLLIGMAWAGLECPQLRLTGSNILGISCHTLRQRELSGSLSH